MGAQPQIEGYILTNAEISKFNANYLYDQAASAEFGAPVYVKEGTTFGVDSCFIFKESGVYPAF